MIVEIDMFSGRPNPRWEVDEGVRRELLELEARLKPATGEAAPMPGLGYRGFVYAGRRAFGRRIAWADGALNDPERTIERLLLSSMPVALEPIRDRVEALLRQ